MTATTTLPQCPRCRSTEAIRILYGEPTIEAFEASERGEIRFGGCVIGPESPELECARCGAELPWASRD